MAHSGGKATVNMLRVRILTPSFGVLLGFLDGLFLSLCAQAVVSHPINKFGAPDEAFGNSLAFVSQLLREGVPKRLFRVIL